MRRRAAGNIGRGCCAPVHQPLGPTLDGVVAMVELGVGQVEAVWGKVDVAAVGGGMLATTTINA